jgi:hypothetical protein
MIGVGHAFGRGVPRPKLLKVCHNEVNAPPMQRLWSSWAFDKLGDGRDKCSVRGVCQVHDKHRLEDGQPSGGNERRQIVASALPSRSVASVLDWEIELLHAYLTAPHLSAFDHPTLAIWLERPPCRGKPPNALHVNDLGSSVQIDGELVVLPVTVHQPFLPEQPDDPSHLRSEVQP